MSEYILQLGLALAFVWASGYAALYVAAAFFGGDE